MLTEAKKKLNIFRSPAFISKLFLKLTKNEIDPSIICVQILKLSEQNRLQEEIASIVPYLAKYSNLMNILTMKDPEANPSEILRQFGTISFFKYYKKHSIIRRPSEKQNWFFLLMSGKISILSVQFDKCGLTKEEYLTYLIKLRLLKEQTMYEQCIQFNQNIGGVDRKFIDSMPKVKYDIYLSKAQAELYEYSPRASFDFNLVLSLSEYIHITSPAKTNGLIDKEAKIKFMIPHYVEVNQLSSGDVFGSLIPIDSNSTMYQEKDYHTYIALTDCDITYINGQSHIKDTLFRTIKTKLKKICREEILSKFYLFQTIERYKFEENYSQLFSYRIVKRGEKIILQGSLSEGIFFLIRGSLEISTKRTFDELDGLIIQLKNSLEEYNNSIMSYTSSEREQINQGLYSNNIFNNENISQLLLEKRKIMINQISSKEAIGLNEFYDPKSKLNYFTVECLSESADLFFIQRNAFMYIFQKEHMLKSAALKLIENKTEFYIESIRRYKERVNYEVGNKSNQLIQQPQKVIPYNRYYQNSELNSEDIKTNHKGIRKTIRLSTNNLISKELFHVNLESEGSSKTPFRHYSSFKLPSLSNHLINQSRNSLLSSTQLPNMTMAQNNLIQSRKSLKEFSLHKTNPRLVTSLKGK